MLQFKRGTAQYSMYLLRTFLPDHKSQLHVKYVCALFRTVTDQYIPPPGTLVQAVTLLNFIREETGSSLGRNVDYPD